MGLCHDEFRHVHDGIVAPSRKGVDSSLGL